MVFATLFLVVFLQHFTAFCLISFQLSCFTLWFVFSYELQGLMSIQDKEESRESKTEKNDILEFSPIQKLGGCYRPQQHDALAPHLNPFWYKKQEPATTIRNSCYVPYQGGERKIKGFVCFHNKIDPLLIVALRHDSI